MRTTPVADRSVWTGADLTRDSTWRFTLTDDHRRDLARALADVEARGLVVAELTVESFPLPTLVAALRAIGNELRNGRGFAFVSGFPIDGYDFGQIELMYYGLCMHLGTGMTQNSDASLIHYVTDGALKPNQGKRGVGVPVASPLHVDLSDVASLLCIRQAPDEPPSWVGSSTQLFNTVLSRRPDALPRLEAGFAWDRMGEEYDGETPASTYLVPVFSDADGRVSCRYNRYWMALAAKRNGGFSAPDHELLDDLDVWAHGDRFEFDFRPGDVQFVNNYTVMHGRAAHAPVPEEERKRILMRIWLDLDDIGPFSDEGIVRYGIIRHGALGWTAEQLLRGEHRVGHTRRPDGAPATATATATATAR